MLVHYFFLFDKTLNLRLKADSPSIRSVAARSSIIEWEEVPHSGSGLVTKVASTSRPASAGHSLELVADRSLELVADRSLAVVVSQAFLVVAFQALAVRSLRRPVAGQGA